MSKADMLLKKATFFEKLVLYSDRNSFLRAIAQGTSLPADIKEGINSVMKDLWASKPDSVPLQNRLMNFYQGENTDLGQLAQALRDAANTIPGDHTEQVQKALDLAQRVQQMATPETTRPDETMYFPADTLKAYPPIDKRQQEALSRFVTMKQIGIPLHRIDGKLGPDTRRALEAVRKYFTEKSPVHQKLSDAEILRNVQMLVENSPDDFG